MNTELNVEKREDITLNKVKEAGSIPAVVYGPKHDAEKIMLNKNTFEKVLREAGESTILSLKGLKEDVDVLIHDVAFNAERGGITHVDFYAVERGKELTTNVVIEFEGEAPVTKDGSMVTKVLHEVEVTCLPRNLPGQLVVDISGMETDDAQITVADITVPEGVVITNEPDAVVATVSAAREEEPEETAADTEAMAEVLAPKEEGEEEEKKAE